MKSNGYQNMARAFTYAGMLPFLYGALAVLGLAPGLSWWPSWVVWPQAMIVYGAVILSFLAGVQWGRSLESALSNRASLGLLVSANVIAVTVWLLLLVAESSWAVIGLMLGFILALAVDYVAHHQQDSQAWFFSLRWQATLVAIVAFLIQLVI